ncbi:GNAT family N-acetyltransferase [Pseudonocardia xinjiangensis]|uniref:GNAT family N-acetyltransferase n=1 Tax=Pseudonocardia xinjiangensis TaxID=75289 RepID=UPI003CD06D2C
MQVVPGDRVVPGDGVCAGAVSTPSASVRSPRPLGVARRALALLTRWAFAHLDLQVIRLWTHADNAPSRAAAERAGFSRNRSGDRLRAVKGEVWPTVAYELRRRTADSTAPPPER